MLGTCSLPAGPTNATASNCTEIPALQVLSSIYEPLHAYVALAICVFGTITNVLNVAVLTQKPLRSPTNILLTCVALADCVTMVVYFVRVVYLHLVTSPLPDGYAHTRTAVHFILFAQATIIGAHTVSTIVLVQLAAFRCCIIYSMGRGDRAVGLGAGHSGGSRVGRSACLSHEAMVGLGILVACLSGAAMALPFFLAYCVSSSQQQQQQQQQQLGEANSTAYWFESRLEYRSLEYTHFLLYGCLVKLLASILILAFSVCILSAMRNAHQRYLHLSDRLNSERPTVNQEANVNTIPLVVREPSGPTDELDRPVGQTPFESALVEDEMEVSTKEVDLRQLAAAAVSRPSQTAPPVVRATTRITRRSRQSQQVTVMLIIVMVSFVVTEAPQGFLNTLVAVKGTCFHDTVYIPLGELLDMAVLLSSSINFILYCTMSQHFRVHFTRLVCSPWRTRCLVKPMGLVSLALQRTSQRGRPMKSNGRDVTLSGAFPKTG